MFSSRVVEYRQHAQECLRLAASATSPEHRAVLVSMARSWHELAQLREDADQPENIKTG
jgi:hypothetical protein